MMRSYGISHVGRVRSNNEDCYAARSELGLYIVADGMGGARAGERASRIAVQTLIDEIDRAGDGCGLDSLVEAVERANHNIRWEARQHPEYSGMGTTLVALMAHPPHAFIVNVGDSRVYHRRGEVVELVTSDHSWINEVGRGLGLSEEQLRTHPYRNVLTKAVGAEDEIDVQRIETDLLPGDNILLCSDGLHGVAGDRTIHEILLRQDTLRARCEALIESALERGAPDNATALLVEYAIGGDGVGR